MIYNIVLIFFCYWKSERESFLLKLCHFPQMGEDFYSLTGHFFIDFLIEWSKMEDRKRRKKLSDFWDGKEPCWIVLECSRYVYLKCPAYLYRERPCWETAYTECEIMTGIKRECRYCKVFKLYNISKTDLRPIISSKDSS